MMPYDENVNRFEAARKSFQWMERSKPSVAARGDVDLPSDSRRLFETGDLPEGIAVPPHERDCGRAHPMCGTDSEDLTAWCREHAADLSTVCGLFPVCGRFFCRIVYIRPVLCYTIYYEIMRSPRRTQHTPAA